MGCQQLYKFIKCQTNNKTNKTRHSPRYQEENWSTRWEGKSKDKTKESHKPTSPSKTTPNQPSMPSSTHNPPTRTTSTWSTIFLRARTERWRRRWKSSKRNSGTIARRYLTICRSTNRTCTVSKRRRYSIRSMRWRRGGKKGWGEWRPIPREASPKSTIKIKSRTPTIKLQ